MDHIFSSKNTFTLNTNKTTYLLLNFFQSFPNTEGFLKSYNRASFDLGLKFMQFNKKFANQHNSLRFVCSK